MADKLTALYWNDIQKTINRLCQYIVQESICRISERAFARMVNLPRKEHRNRPGCVCKMCFIDKVHHQLKNFEDLSSRFLAIVTKRWTANRGKYSLKLAAVSRVDFQTEAPIQSQIGE